MMRLMQLLGLVALVVAFVHILWHWPTLPNEVPSHYNALGEVDAWSNKWFIFFPPTIGLVLWLVLSQIHKYPQFINVPIPDKPSAKQMQTVMLLITCIQLEISLIFSYLSIKDVYVAKDITSGSMYEVPIIIGTILATVMLFSIRIYRQAS